MAGESARTLRRTIARARAAPTRGWVAARGGMPRQQHETPDPRVGTGERRAAATRGGGTAPTRDERRPQSEEREILRESGEIRINGSQIQRLVRHLAAL